MAVFIQETNYSSGRTNNFSSSTKTNYLLSSSQQLIRLLPVFIRRRINRRTKKLRLSSSRRIIRLSYKHSQCLYSLSLVHSCRKDRGFSPSDVCETVPYKTKYGANISSFAKVYIHIKHSLNYISQKTLSPIFGTSVNRFDKFSVFVG